MNIEEVQNVWIRVYVYLRYVYCNNVTPGLVWDVWSCPLVINQQGRWCLKSPTSEVSTTTTIEDWSQ